jgi:hypothetical protein
LAHHERQPLRAQKIEEIKTHFDLDADIRDLKKAIGELVVRVLERHGVIRPNLAAFDLSALVHGMVQAAVLAGAQDFGNLSERISRAALGYLAPIVTKPE